MEFVRPSPKRRMTFRSNSSEMTVRFGNNISQSEFSVRVLYIRHQEIWNTDLLFPSDVRCQELCHCIPTCLHVVCIHVHRTGLCVEYSAYYSQHINRTMVRCCINTAFSTWHALQKRIFYSTHYSIPA